MDATRAFRYSLLALPLVIPVSFATTATARPHQGFDRHSVGEQRDTYLFEAARGVRAKKLKRKREKLRRIRDTTIHLARPVVVPQRFARVDDDTIIPLPRQRPVIDLVTLAAQHLGTNPTGWRSVWCGKFMALVAPQAAKRIPNPNLARNWARLPHVEPRRGAVAVLTRGGGGHVGVIVDVKKNGDLILISGNHNRRVGIGRYSRSRLIAAVAA